MLLISPKKWSFVSNKNKQLVSVAVVVPIAKVLCQVDSLRKHTYVI